MIMKYEEIKVVPGPAIEVKNIDGGKQCGLPVGSGTELLNKHLSEGFELIQVIEHYQDDVNCTVLAFVIGKPAGKPNRRK